MNCKVYKILLLLFVICSSNKCNEGKVKIVSRYLTPMEHGYYVEYEEKNGVKDGFYRLYDENMDFIQTGHYKNGKMDSIWKTTHKSVPGWYETTYDNGNPIKTQYFYANGQLNWTEIQLDRSKLDKVTEMYTVNGDSLYPGTINNGNGTFNRYNEAGKLIKVYYYKNGYMVGGENLSVQDSVMINVDDISK